MPGPSSAALSASATPTQRSFVSQPSGAGAPADHPGASRPSLERDAPPAVPPKGGGRNLAASAVSFAPRGSSLAPSPAPGSFSSDLRNQQAVPPRAASRADVFAVMDKVDEDGGSAAAEQTLSALHESLNREMKIREGSENMLEALNTKKAKQTRDQRQKVEAELNSSNQKIKELRQKISDARRTLATPTTPTRTRTGTGGADSALQGPNGSLLRSPPSASRSGAGSDVEEPAESPTFALAEILQALEVDGMTPEYYVSRANSLVDLFKRHPTLKYDLVWSVFGPRMQVMLLSESREVVAAGYRIIRYVVSDVSSLKKIRSLKTDYLVTWSLIKDNKADVEREQALKFVRAFLDVKDGVRELSRAIVRTIAAIARAPEERLKPICLETLAEILVRDPRLLVASGGLAPLSEALADGSYKAPESLTSAFLLLLDSPRRRKYLRPGYELEVLFTCFTDVFSSNERLLKQNAKAVASALKSWSGLMSLSMYDFRAVRSLISSLMLPNGPIRETIIDLFYSLLRIKPPAWASTFFAGRRLTTYGRVATLKSSAAPKGSTAAAASASRTHYFEDDGGEQNFVDHYTALLLALFVRSGLVPSLLELTQTTDNPTLKRKSVLLIGEVLTLASRLLPPSWSSSLQLLPELFAAATRLHDEDHFIATGIVYQISSVCRILHRSSPSAYAPSFTAGALSLAGVDAGGLDEQPKVGGASSSMLDDGSFRQLILESAVLSSSNYVKWNWDVIVRIMEGPLTSGKRLEEATKASKFVKRIMSFYRPFKYRFSDVKATRSAQKYVRAGCALMHALLQSAEGTKYLADNKLLRQIAECLAQCDPTSGLTAQFPVFAPDRLTDTLSGGYFAMLGVLGGDPKGLQMLDRWRIFNMMYHIVDLKQRPDLIKLLLSNFDYAVHGHPRVLLSKALTSGTKDIRIHATDVLRKLATRPRRPPDPEQPASVSSSADDDWKWAIQLLVTQLYDPEVEVCAAAVKILEKACNSKDYLEYIVQCRPALDHLGEIGAPLLLRFLSTSIGYHYLDGLDYISNEMDDWFLGRNDSYVSVIEASLARAFGGGGGAPPDDHYHYSSSDLQHAPHRLSVFDDDRDADADMGHVPPHFYRELTRTHEGCRLLRDKGHFDEFAATIRDHGLQSDDPEMLTKVKGCLWAVGNVGSMDLGAPFLESCDVVGHIVRVAQEHQVMSLRGTAFFVLGLISRSVHGLEILSEHGWDANTNIVGHSLGLCIPADLSRFLSMAPWQHHPVTSVTVPDGQKTETVELPPVPSRPRSESLLKALEEEEAQSTARAEDRARAADLLDPDPTNRRILELVVDMANMVLYRRARNELMQIKQIKKAPGFRQPHLFRRVMALLERHSYRLPDRSLIVGLFDRAVLRHVVLGADDAAAGGRVSLGSTDSTNARGRGDSFDEDEDVSGSGGGDNGRGDLDEDEDEARRKRRRRRMRQSRNMMMETEGSSSDEQGTERQRSIGDPAELTRA